MSFFSTNRKKNTKGQRIAKLKRKIASKARKLSQEKELKSLQQKWQSMRKY